MNKQTTKVEIKTIHKLTLKVIEQAIHQAAKRMRDGTVILPETQDRQAAYQIISKLLDGDDELKKNELELVDIYMFTLAQVTSAIVTVFDDVSTDSD